MWTRLKFWHKLQYEVFGIIHRKPFFPVPFKLCLNKPWRSYLFGLGEFPEGCLRVPRPAYRSSHTAFELVHAAEWERNLGHLEIERREGWIWNWEQGSMNQHFSQTRARCLIRTEFGTPRDRELNTRQREKKDEYWMKRRVQWIDIVHGTRREPGVEQLRIEIGEDWREKRGVNTG